MSSSTAGAFQSFLSDSIWAEVLIINTNIGMEIYYYSENDYSNFIRESALLYTIKNIDTTKLRFKNSLSSEEVRKNFVETIITFAQYPQLFLAYAKKFIHLKSNNSHSKYIMPALNSFFEDAMAFLAETGKVPHYDKIQRAKNKSQKLDSNQKIIYDLISEILLKKHRNN
ncbi:hypothetical protein [Aquimarina litoralis]|uniref:hypothetical protein n=1 Tax=Aquimarina litoralis TaxID=584605 RepID=UPI001C57BE25|nr:hypothetical protein [Aquimarina litoralis]MBW1294708.1 hypothetical protein [Aquimarina litoralis]